MTDAERTGSTRAEPIGGAFPALMFLAERTIRFGKRIDLITIATDHVAETKRTYSPLGLGYPENELNAALSKVIAAITPTDRSDLESALKEKPDWKKQQSHTVTSRWEWPTLREGLILGVETIVDDRRGEEWVRTWYVRRENK